MKLVWCPESAAKAYIDAVRVLSTRHLEEADVAELVSAMAGGWKAQLVLEAWAPGSGAATTVALRASVQHTQGRHVCVVPDGTSAAEYADAVRREGARAEGEVVVGETLRGLEGVDMLVVDCRRRDAGRVLREVWPGPRGMVVVCKWAAAWRLRGGAAAWRWRGGAAAVALGAGKRVVRSAYLPIGGGVEVLHVGVGKGPSLGGVRGRWCKHVDRRTKEEHIFRRDRQ